MGIATITNSLELNCCHPGMENTFLIKIDFGHFIVSSLCRNEDEGNFFYFSTWLPFHISSHVLIEHPHVRPLQNIKPTSPSFHGRIY